MADQAITPSDSMPLAPPARSALTSAPSPMLLMSRLAKQVMRRGNEERLGMPLKQMVALSYLKDRGGTPQQELADALGIDANMVVLLLNELEDRGYVERRRDPLDRRRHHVQITGGGDTALAATEPGRRAIEEEILGALSPDERATLTKLLSRAVSGLERPDGT